MPRKIECPGCGIPDLKGPFPNDDGYYYECHHCDRHVYREEVEDATGTQR